MISKKTVSELAEYLKKVYRFKETLRDIDPNTIHRGLLEELLKKNNFDTYVRLCDFQRLDNTPFYNFLVQKIEVEQIIEAINRLSQNQIDKSFADVPVYVKKHSKLNLLELRSAENIEDLKKALKGTPYFKIISKISIDDENGFDYIKCERMLVSFYYSRLIDDVEKDFFKGDSEQLKDIILMEVDLVNIRNAYRKKAFFNYDSERIKNTQIPFSKIGKRRMNSFYEKANAEEMLEYLNKTPYGKNMLSHKDYLEVKLQTVFSRYLQHIVARNNSAPVVIYAFMKLCDMEVKNIIHIIEGIRYEVAPDVIEKNLIVY